MSKSDQPVNPASSDSAPSRDRPLPARVDRKRGAQIVSDLFFPVSPRTLEVWPVVWRRVNGRATCDTTDLLGVAQKKLDAAPAILGGRTPRGASIPHRPLED